MFKELTLSENLFYRTDNYQNNSLEKSVWKKGEFLLAQNQP